MKKYLTSLLALTMALSLAACGGSGGTAADAGSSDAAADGGADSGAKEYRVSVVLKTNSSEHWAYVQAGAEAYEKEHPEVTVDVKGPPSEVSYDEQQNMIETDMNNAGIDAYVIAPLQSDMVANMISGQTKPVIALDTNTVRRETRRNLNITSVSINFK